MARSTNRKNRVLRVPATRSEKSQKRLCPGRFYSICGFDAGEPKLKLRRICVTISKIRTIAHP
jgi:hypothetical protein